MVRFILCLLAASILHAAAPVYEASFDTPNNGWTVVRGTAAPDAAVMHDNKEALRLEAGPSGTDACVRLAPVSLTIGKRYELSGWVKTGNLQVRDLPNEPIASGAALTMASMPFDVHSASVGGGQGWTRLTLRFVATRSHDSILLTAGNGGMLHGKAWFAGVNIDEASSQDAWPAKEAVETFGPAYRYPKGGWIYLHIEGKPYDRGYQHGYLMAGEISEYLARCSYLLGGRTDEETWDTFRTSANALFLRGFDREILEEMRGIVDGANAHGAKFLNRKLDLIDLVVANTAVEMGKLRAAVLMTPTGLEGLHFSPPGYSRPARDAATDHCSAFAAAGPATRDGKMVIGHVTWWSQTLGEMTNVMLDIQPSGGHRLLMQSYPGGIESGTDWYQNDAGVVLTETTIRQTPFNRNGTPVAFRARRAIQYGGNIDEVIHELGTRNNGLYTNEWIIGDAKTNEIAMYELGTNHTRLWRSSKNEWFGGTVGFYWGDNNAKDLTINLEYEPDPQGPPAYVPYVPMVRDLAWQKLYHEYKGKIDEQFGFLAFRTAPLVAHSTIDAKIVTAGMANNMMVWAEMGRPNQTVAPAPAVNPGPVQGLYPDGYHLFTAKASNALLREVADNEKQRLAKKPEETKPAESKKVSYEDRLWKGWVLPASDADTWFVAGSADYYRLLDAKDPEAAIAAEIIRYRGLKLAPETPLNRFRLEQARGALFLDALRRKMGDDAFLKLMKDYFAANTTKTVTAQSFLDRAGTTYSFTEPGEGPAYLPGDINERLATAVIVYGTVDNIATNRYAAEQLQKMYRDRGQQDVQIFKDFEVSDEYLKNHDVVFVGRPSTNSALANWAGQLGLDYHDGVLKLDGKTFASERDSLVFAASNPLNAAHMVLVYAGNDPLHTVKALIGQGALTPYLVTEDAKLLAGKREDGRWRR
jgi:hypothetical protein